MTKASIERSFDGIRGVAALIVILSHTSNFQIKLAPFLNFSGWGQFGVFVFFFLSAFLLSQPYFEDPSKALPWREWMRYGIRRLARIVPLYYFVCISTFYLKTTYFSGELPASVLLDHLTFQIGYSVFWTIPVEVKFYVLLPVLVIVFNRAGRSDAGVAMVLAAAIGWLCVLSANVAPDILVTLTIHKYVTFFVFGTVAALVHVHWGRRIGTLFGRHVLDLIAIGGVLFLLTQIPGFVSWLGMSWLGMEEFSLNKLEEFYSWRHLWFGVVLLGVFLSFLNGHGLVKAIFSARPLNYLGRISFGMYLLHLPVIEMISPLAFPAPIKFIGVIVLTVMVSVLVHHAIEMPGIRWGKRLSDRLKPGRSPQAVLSKLPTG